MMSPGPVHSPLRSASPRAAWTGLLLTLILGGCGGDERGPYPIETGRERERPERRVPPGASTRDRFGFDAERSPAAFRWKLPAGWEVLPAAGVRLASFRVAGATPGESGDVSVSRTGGNLSDNVNRWRRQMGLAPVGSEELAALPKRELLGKPAVLVDLRGAFTDMGASEALPDRRLLGLILEEGAHSLFVKFVGPAALVKTQRAPFEAFAASLREGRDAGAHGGAGAAPPEPPAPDDGLDPQRLRWDSPKGWSKSPTSKPFRVTDFRIEGAPGADAYLSHLDGSGGGIALNVNRWRAQAGAPQLDEAAVDALERIDVLGGKAVFVEHGGDYQGMGGQRVTDAVFYGVIVMLKQDAVFLVLVGPRAEVEPQREAFRVLARSLRVEA